MSLVGTVGVPEGSTTVARRSLSAQVIEEIDRARGLLGPVKDIVDPMTAHMVGAVLESLHKVEGMCLNATRVKVAGYLGGQDVVEELGPEDPTEAPVRRRSGAHKAPRKRKDVA